MAQRAMYNADGSVANQTYWNRQQQGINYNTAKAQNQQMRNAANVANQQLLRTLEASANNVQPVPMTQQSLGTAFDKLGQNPAYRLLYDVSPNQPVLDQFMMSPEQRLIYGNPPDQLTDPEGYQRWMNNPLERFQSSPGYQFQMDQGLEQLQNNMGSKGLLNSGAAMKAMNEYAQGVANQDWNNWANRETGLYDAFKQNRAATWSDYQNRLAALASGGMQQAGQISLQGALTGSNMYQNNGQYQGGLLAGLGQQTGNMYLQSGLGQGQAMTSAAGSAAQLAASQNALAAQQNASMGQAVGSLLGSIM